MPFLSRTGIGAATLLLTAVTAAAQSVTHVTVGLNGAQPNGVHGAGVVSGDGRVVAFTSAASNLVAGDTNGSWDVFVRDLTAGTTTRVSVGTDGLERVGDSTAVDISDDGRYVVFASTASLVAGDTATCVAVPGGAPTNCLDIYLRDRQTSETVRISLAPGGAEPNGYSGQPHISGDGRFVVFESDATNLVAGDTNAAVDAFLVDRQTSALTRVSVGVGGAQAETGGSSPRISDDGTVIGFISSSTLSADPDSVLCQPIPGTTLQPPCLRPFLFDRGRSETRRVPMPAIQTSGFLPLNPPVTYTIRVEARTVVPSDDGTSVAVGVATTSTLRRQGIPIIADRGWIYDRTLDRIVYDRGDITPYAWTGRVLAYRSFVQGPQATPNDAVAIGVFEPAGASTIQSRARRRRSRAMSATTGGWSPIGRRPPSRAPIPTPRQTSTCSTAIRTRTACPRPGKRRSA